MKKLNNKKELVGKTIEQFQEGNRMAGIIFTDGTFAIIESDDYWVSINDTELEKMDEHNLLLNVLPLLSESSMQDEASKLWQKMNLKFHTEREERKVKEIKQLLKTYPELKGKVQKMLDNIKGD